MPCRLAMRTRKRSGRPRGLPSPAREARAPRPGLRRARGGSDPERQGAGSALKFRRTPGPGPGATTPHRRPWRRLAVRTRTLPGRAAGGLTRRGGVVTRRPGYPRVVIFRVDFPRIRRPRNRARGRAVRRRRPAFSQRPTPARWARTDSDSAGIATRRVFDSESDPSPVLDPQWCSRPSSRRAGSGGPRHGLLSSNPAASVSSSLQASVTRKGCRAAPDQPQDPRHGPAALRPPRGPRSGPGPSPDDPLLGLQPEST